MGKPRSGGDGGAGQAGAGAGEADPRGTLVDPGGSPMPPAVGAADIEAMIAVKVGAALAERSKLAGPQVPGIGRMVLYAPVNGPKVGDQPKEYPATITHAYEHAFPGQVNLAVDNDGEFKLPEKSLHPVRVEFNDCAACGAKPGTWRWPPRV